MRDYALLYINGKRYEVRGEDAFLSLADFLRSKGLTGTKVVCAEGDCGACSVLIGELADIKDNRFYYKTVNSCIVLTGLLDCAHVVTVEGLKQSGKEELHPAQRSMVDHHGSQCGFCTPGFVMGLTALREEVMDSQEELTEQKVKNALTGNLCRCTGYKGIIDAGIKMDTSDTKALLRELYDEKKIMTDLRDAKEKGAVIKHQENILYAPTQLKQFLSEKQIHPEGVIFSGATDNGVRLNKAGNLDSRFYFSLKHLDPLYELGQTDEEVHIGALVTLSRLERKLKALYPAFTSLLEIFASPQIKNRATLVGNIVNASPVGDSLPFLTVMDAKLEIMSSEGVRIVAINDFYKGYKVMDLQANEVMTKVILPKLKEREILKLIKVSARKDMDISALSLGAKLTLQDNTIKDAVLSYGGMGPTVLRVKNIEESLKSKEFTLASFQDSAALVEQEMTPLSDVRGSSDFRMQVAKNLLEKLYHEVKDQVVKS